jgi:hypothetical protein
MDREVCVKNVVLLGSNCVRVWNTKHGGEDSGAQGHQRIHNHSCGGPLEIHVLLDQARLHVGAVLANQQHADADAEEDQEGRLHAGERPEGGGAELDAGHRGTCSRNGWMDFQAHTLMQNVDA